MKHAKIIGVCGIAMTVSLVILILWYAPFLFSNSVTLPAPKLIQPNDESVSILIDSVECDQTYVVERSINQNEWKSLGIARSIDSEGSRKACQKSYQDNEILVNTPILYYRYRLLNQNGVVLRSSEIASLVPTNQSVADLSESAIDSFYSLGQVIRFPGIVQEVIQDAGGGDRVKGEIAVQLPDDWTLPDNNIYSLRMNFEECVDASLKSGDRVFVHGIVRSIVPDIGIVMSCEDADTKVTKIIQTEPDRDSIPVAVWNSYQELKSIYIDWVTPTLSWCTKDDTGFYYIAGSADETSLVYYYSKEGTPIGFYAQGVLGDYSKYNEKKGSKIDMTGYSCEAVPQVNSSELEEIQVQQMQDQDWATYKNTELGFGFLYPEKWKIQEYINMHGQLGSIAIDPVRVASQQTWETMDVRSGIVQFDLEYDNGRCTPLSDEYATFVHIGTQNLLAEKRDRIEINSPNPWYEGKHIISHRINRIDQPTGCTEVVIMYVSKPEDVYLQEFNTIISTFYLEDIGS